MKKDFLFASLLILMIAALYALRLDFPATQYYDEVYHVKAARELISLVWRSNSTHPVFGRLLIAFGIHIFGDHSWAWRFFPLICGIGVLTVFFALAKKLFKSPGPALFAVALLALDGISITQSRMAMLNASMLFFMLLAVWFFVKAFETPRPASLPLLLSGVFLGLTAATRLVGLEIFFLLILLGAVYFPAAQEKRALTLRCLLFLIAVPVLVYASLHLLLLFCKGHDLASLWKFQTQMIHYHTHLKEQHAYGSAWWSWPVTARPIWYFFERDNGLVRGILCIGNPAVLWASIPAFGYLVWDTFRSPRFSLSSFVLAGFLSQWLPWSFLSRVKFFHYYYTAMPFVVLAVTLYVRALWHTGRTGKIFAAGYLLLVFAMAVYWYPLWTGYPISERYFQNHLWFKSWI